MISLDDKHLMMIEPNGQVSGWTVFDEHSRMAHYLFSLAITGTAWRGWHTCACGKRSGNCDLVLPDGTITNSLMVHYVEDHRGECPEEELVKLAEKAIAAGFKVEKI